MYPFAPTSHLRPGNKHSGVVRTTDCEAYLLVCLARRCHSSVVTRLLTIALLLLALGFHVAGSATVETHVTSLAGLIDPAKLGTLAKRGANPRIQKAIAILARAESDNVDPGVVCAEALQRVGMDPTAGELTKVALLRNLDIARKLGCLDSEGLNEMRHGKSPTIRKGPYEGDQLSVDHIIPYAVAPELDKVVANLELMPLRMNQSKQTKVGIRQVGLAEKLTGAGLLTQNGLKRVKQAFEDGEKADKQ